jgi:Rhodanese-like domain
VKNNTTLRFLVFFLAVSCLGFQADCEKAQQVPYVKYENADQIPRITIEDAKKDYDAGIAVIIDSRGEAQYKQEHIAKSINIPFGSPESRFSEIPKGKKIIVYCS